ncbi:MAG: LUD domain-containing protein [Candidatus Saccharimonadales bacterium]|jgi:L-lactate utilization protein LutC
MSHYNEVADEATIKETVEALTTNNIETQVVDDLATAKKVVTEIIPDGAEVFTASSVTLQEAGLDKILNETPYVSVRAKFKDLYNQPDKAIEMRRLGSAAEYAIGSVHAVTKDGQLMIASATGSQIPNEVYGANHVIFVVGAQKIVTDINDGLERIKQHSVPLENERAKKAYGVSTSFNKLLIIFRENPGRVKVIIVRQNVGY